MQICDGFLKSKANSPKEGKIMFTSFFLHCHKPFANIKFIKKSFYGKINETF